jgi:hypothetical protein
MRTFRKRYAAWRLNGGELIVKEDTVFPEGSLDVLDFCERIAFLTRAGHLDEEQVWSVFGNWIGAYAHDLDTNMSRLRTRQKTAYEEFAWLVARLKRIDKRKGGCFFENYEQQDLIRLYEYDLGCRDGQQMTFPSTETS